MYVCSFQYGLLYISLVLITPFFFHPIFPIFLPTHQHRPFYSQYFNTSPSSLVCYTVSPPFSWPLSIFLAFLSTQCQAQLSFNNWHLKFLLHFYLFSVYMHMPWYTVASEDSSNRLLPLCSCPPWRSLSWRDDLVSKMPLHLGMAVCTCNPKVCSGGTNREFPEVHHLLILAALVNFRFN